MNAIRPVTIGDAGSFSRASTKTFIGADGLIHTAPVDVPAFQYSPVNLAAAPAAMLELAATNSLLYADQFDNAAWTKAGGVTVTANAVTAPDGTLTADTVDFTAAANATGVSQAVTVPNDNLARTGSIYVQAGTCTAFTVDVQYANGTPVTNTATVDLIAGTVTGTGVSIDPPLIGGWRRISVSVANNGSGNTSCSLLLRRSTTGGTLAIWRAQLETGSTATSSIPTTSAAATRAADIVTGTGLVYSNAPEAAPALYNSATTYGFGATVSIAGTAGLMTVYQSLQAVNVGHAPASSPTWWSNIGTTYQTYTIGATFALGDLVVDLIGHVVYESLITSNTGHPLTDETKWGKVGATNRWAAFDDVVGTSVALAGPVLMLLVPGAIDSLGMLNIAGQSSTIAMTDTSSMTTVFSQTTDLADDASITDYDQYFFEEEVTVSDLYTDSLPPYYSGVLSIALTGVSGASLGVAKLGLQFDLGGAQYGLKVGFISYTKKETDLNTGYISAKKGAVSKRMTVTTMIDNDVLDKTLRVMEELDGVPTVFAGVGNLFTSLIQFAFCKSFEIEISYPANSLCSFEQEGLV